MHVAFHPVIMTEIINPLIECRLVEHHESLAVELFLRKLPV